MDLTLQPKPEVTILPADKGIVSRREFFVKKKVEEINQYYFPAHLIRKWKPKVELLYTAFPDEAAIQYECDFNRDIQNCFVEDYAEEVFLKSPPPCFVIIGKFGSNAKKLSEEIAKEYGSVLIQVDDIVNQVLQTQTETSRVLIKILRFGVALTLNFILALLSYVAHTAEARHRGYVLCGLPIIPHLHDLSVEQQFNYLFTWENKPTVFIHVLFEDEDLVNERTNTRCEIVNNGKEKENFILSHLRYNDTSADDDDDDDKEQDELLPVVEKTEGYERDINISPSRPWVLLPRDMESQVWAELELFDVKIKPMIELITSRVDPQYFITVDSRVNNEFEVVQSRLNLLHIWKSPLAFPFIPLKETKRVEFKGEADEGEETDLEEQEVNKNAEQEMEINRVVNEPPEKAFLKLFDKKVISPKYRWELSHYNYICPVSLRAGVVVEGKSEFAVCFMKYIYFLRSKEFMIQFLKNPRAFVLPIRPRPLCRFIILGLPLTGKTTLAQSLANEFSIPIIDCNKILYDDIEKKKDIYQEFCRQKAESREISRLTTQSWKDWRLEEEYRLYLIEEWMSYIQSLLERRIKEFYADDNDSSKEQSYSTAASSLNFQLGEESDVSEGGQERSEGSKGKKPQVHYNAFATSSEHQRVSAPGDNNSTISAPNIRAKKHVDYDVNENSAAVKTNLFLSSLWNTFSNSGLKQHCFRGESDQSEAGENSIENLTVDWCSLLPPQSLSSFLMQKKKPLAVREKKKSFRIFLQAASKAYWSPSLLKTEFVKWQLPCYMDIPLCEIFLDNPILLFKYIPEWLKERPQIPDPIDPMHPSVVEAGRKAFLRAQIVNVTQTTEEKAILLGDAIEKAEREGMRVSGEVISPGGWIIDSMFLDEELWIQLAKRNIFPDHVYFLMDSEPEFARIIHTWCELNCIFQLRDKKSDDTDSEYSLSLMTENYSEKKESFLYEGRMSENLPKKFTLVTSLIAALTVIQQGDDQLDEIFDKVINFISDDTCYIPPFSIDLFSHDFLQNTFETWCNLKEEYVSDEDLFSSSHNLFNRQLQHCTGDLPLGLKLVIFGNKILKMFETEELQFEKDLSLERALKFFAHLMSLPNKLAKIKELLENLNRGISIKEIDVMGKTPMKVFSDIKKELFEPFIKKPRELERFEIEEIREDFLRGAAPKNEYVDEFKGEDDEAEEEQEKREDVRIYGEAGPLCIVNLERNILLLGKQEHVLRYYGKLYFFYNKDAKNKFIEDPEKYAPYYSPIRCLPPPRIFFLGPVGCGKTTLALPLANQCSLKFENYIHFLSLRVVPYKDAVEKLTALTEQKLILSDSHNKEAKAMVEKFMNASYTERQYWLDSPHYTTTRGLRGRARESIIFMKSGKELTNVPDFLYKHINTVNEGSHDANLSNNDLTQKPFFSMKELESHIVAYVQETDKLLKYCADISLKRLWTEKPYITNGFILEGFPLKQTDIKFITDNNWIPDLVVEIISSEKMVVENNINALMQLWDTKLKQEVIEERMLEDAVTAMYKNRIATERQKLIVQKRNEYRRWVMAREESEADAEDNMKKTESLNGETIPSEVEFAIQQQADKVLAEKFPNLVFNPNFETYDAGKERILKNLVNNYKRDMSEIQNIKILLKSFDVPWLEISGFNNKEQNYIDVMLAMDRLKNRVDCKGEFAFTMSMEMAERLLRQGFYFLSKFGRWCPVQVYRMTNSIHMFRPLAKRGRITPVAYRNYIYFIGGANEAKKFIEDPIKYTFNEPRHPNIPLRIAIIGPPKSGKSTLSRRLGLMFDMKVVTMGSALRFVLEKMPETTLVKTINNYLRRGCFLPLSLKIEALMACLNDPKCATQGFIFDGIPFDAALTQSLAEQRKLPFVIISLVADPYFCKNNREGVKLEEFRLPYKNRVNLDSKYREWEDTYKRFLQWNQDTYNNVYELNAKSNPVDTFYQAYDIIRKSYFGILYYVEYCVSDKVLPLQYLCVSQHEYELRKSSFLNYCPVCWLEQKKLNPSRDPPPRTGLVQYLNYFYWICPNDMEKFIKNPKMYLPPNCPTFPEVLPTILLRSMFETASHQLRIHGYGRCPVTRTDFPSHLDWEGSWDFAVSYAEEVYLCKNRERMDRFLARPWRYWDADTEFEMNRPAKSGAVKDLGPPTLTSLPPVGFLEQTVASLISECLQVVGLLRPVYPNLSPACSGCVFVALYLIVHNKKNINKKHLLEKEYLNFMQYYCNAFLYQNSQFKRPSIGENELQVDVIDSIESDSDDSQIKVSQQHSDGDFSMDSYWLDLDLLTEKKMWSAKSQTDDRVKMELTEDGQLFEVTDLPKISVILKYQTYKLRPNPIPPVANCINFIYSVKPRLQIPEKFNYNTLYQTPPLFSSPYQSSLIFNPDKRFGVELFKECKPEYPSETNLWKGNRARSKSPESIRKPLDPGVDYMLERFIPRFELIDKLTSTKVPPPPKAVDKNPILYNPHRDYAYTMLFFEFFHVTHVLKCYEWDESVQELEFLDRFMKNLGLANVQIDYNHLPKRTESMKTMRTNRSYQDAFDSANLFMYHQEEKEPDDYSNDSERKSSISNFIQNIMSELMEDMFVRVPNPYLSYDSYEMHLSSQSSATSDKNSILIQEIFPYPPLIWDIISRPYYSYVSASSVFRIPQLESIAHERNVSLLDGIEEPNSGFRFVRYPSELEKPVYSTSSIKIKKCNRILHRVRHKFYPVFEFFDLPWTAFLPYSISWAYNKSIRDNFCESNECNEHTDHLDT